MRVVQGSHERVRCIERMILMVMMMMIIIMTMTMMMIVGDFWGPPMAHVAPAPPGPKDCKHRGEELVSYQFIRETAGQKVSPLAGSVVVALTDKMLLS